MKWFTDLGPQLRELLKWSRPLPSEDERLRLLHEVGYELERSFNGKALNLVKSCGKSARKLVALVTRHFPVGYSSKLYRNYDWVDVLRKEDGRFLRSFNENAKVNHITLIGFRDHSVYKGHQVFFYKRAQIFAADLWGAFKGQGYGEFDDIGSITIFADYIVPAVLRQLGVLKCSSALMNTIEANDEVVSGTKEEIELRACSIYERINE